MSVPSYLTEDRYTIKLPGSIKGIAQDLVRVRHTSPLTHRRAVERFAYYFKREFSYDFPQFEAEDTEDYRAWLFASDQNSPAWRAIGAACFRHWLYDGDEKQSWSLQWIWLHPFLRGEGRLKKAWSTFIEEIGEPVEVEPPFSHAMVAFLRHVDANTLAQHTRDAVISGEPLRLAKK
jgi:hypothetical protein